MITLRIYQLFFSINWWIWLFFWNIQSPSMYYTKTGHYILWFSYWVDVTCSVKEKGRGRYIAHRLVSSWLQVAKHELRLIVFCDHQWQALCLNLPIYLRNSLNLIRQAFRSVSLCWSLFFIFLGRTGLTYADHILPRKSANHGRWPIDQSATSEGACFETCSMSEVPWEKCVALFK